MVPFSLRRSSLAKSVTLGGVASFACGCGVAFVLYAFGVIPKEVNTGPSTGAGNMWLLFFGMVVFSPAVETLFLSLSFKLISWKVSARLAAPLAGAIVAAAHSYVHWAWGVVVFVPFLIYSAPFSNVGAPFAYRMASSALTHAINNTLVFMILLFAT